MGTEINDLKSLQQRIDLLRGECRSLENKMNERVTYYQHNAGSLILENLLKRVFNVSAKQTMRTWTKNNVDDNENERKSNMRSDLFQASLAVALPLGLKYFKKIFK